MDTTRFRPLNDQVLVRPLVEESNQHGSIVIPQSADRTCHILQGEVIACGPGDHLRNGKRGPMHVKPGDRILYPHRTGEPVKIDGVDYLVMHEEQFVLAVIE